MGKYLDMVRRLSEAQPPRESDEGISRDAGCEKSEVSEESPEHRRLLDTGWVPKTRGGKIIWASPQTGFWYGEEVALELLRLDKGPPGAAPR